MKHRLLTCLLAVATASASGETPSGEEILRRVEENFQGIDDYTVALDITVDLERLKVPPMHVMMYFKQPDRVHFSSRGFALLPKESFAFTRAGLRTNFDVEKVEEHSDSAGLRYALTLKPNKDKTRLRRLVLTVNPEHWLPERLAAPQLDGRTMGATFRHEQVDGRWLPAALDVSFAAPDLPADEPALPGTPRQPVPRNGSISIRFSGYRLNTGLPDSLFNDTARDH
jgi:outer membrane lipoprotein-sorting protein